MEANASDHLSYFLLIDKSEKENLSSIRQWSNLKVAFEENRIWIRDLDYAQIHSVEVKSIPAKTLFYARDGKLCLLNSRLPDRNIPSLLWTPIDRALPVKLPPFNHNYFGLQNKITLSLAVDDKVRPAEAMITGIRTLERYLVSAPEIRTKNLSWCLLNNDRAFVLGQPGLPVPGAALWKREDLFLPAGYDLELHLLSEIVCRTLDPDNSHFILWNSDNTYALIEKADLQPLSLGSFRRTLLSFPVQ